MAFAMPLGMELIMFVTMHLPMPVDMSLTMSVAMPLTLPVTMQLTILLYIDLNSILNIAYSNNCQGIRKGMGPDINFGKLQGIALHIIFALLLND